MTTLASLSERFQNEGFSRTLAAEIEAAVVARRTQPGEHRDWALLCEQVGLMSLAFSEFQLALRDDRDDPVAGFHLAQLYRERGDTSRALGLLDRLLGQQPANEPWLSAYAEILAEDGGALPLVEQVLQNALAHGLPPASAERLRRAVRPADRATVASVPAEPDAELTPSDADCVRFHTLFSGREGVHARQWVRSNGEGGYSPVHEPLTPAVIRNHLLGSFTAGVYPIRLDGTATFFALDLDIDKQALQRARGEPAYAQQLRDTLRVEGPRLLNVLRDLGFAPLFENSGYKGRHYWVLLEEPQTAEVLHLLGRMLLAWQSPQVPSGLHLEFFPKQGSVRDKGKGLGNLIKLPLGIHRRTGRRSQLLDDQGTALADPLAALRAVGRTSRTTLYAAVERLKALAGSSEPPATIPFAGTPTTDLEEPPTTAAPSLPPPPPPAPVWTEADFETEPRVRHLLVQCPVLAELKRTVDEHRRLSHEEQLVLIHTLGHLEGGPQAVNYLLDKCIDVGPEKRMKDRLKGNPVSCPSIRKKIPHITRRLACNCAFEFAADRYPTPVLYLLTLPEDQRTPAPAAPSDALLALAQRFGVIQRQRAEIESQWQELRRSLITALSTVPERSVAFELGRYRVVENEGVEELVWEEEAEQHSEDEAVKRA
jgi:tetratricopeptide (TPR) repeat protein